jgi:alpha-L-rhamnosidase
LKVELSLTMEPNESILLVFQPEKRALLPRPEPGSNAGHKTLVITRDPAPAQAEPQPPIGSAPALARKGCSWTWFPEGDPAQAALPGTRYFRRQITIPPGATIRKASFAGTADNSFTLFINGKQAGQSDNSPEGWRNPVELDVTACLHPSLNQLAIAATNGGDKPNPAGLIGRLTIELESGTALTERVGQAWKTSNQKTDHWAEAGFDDTAWPSAREFLPFGGAPWGMLAGQITLSPVKADPFFGHCEVATADLSNSRVYLELGALAPETAARVAVNGNDAGGFVSKPARLDVSRFLKPGANTLHIEPFAPESARLVVYPRLSD